MPLSKMSFKLVLSVLVVKQSAKVNDPMIAVEWKKRGRLGSSRAMNDLNATRPSLLGRVLLLYYCRAVYNFASFC